MLISGVRKTRLFAEIIPDKCSHCGLTNTLQLSIYQRFVHFFWIPFIPIWKTAHTDCKHCKQVVEKQDFLRGTLEQYEALKIKAGSPPIWTFSGLIILLALFVAGAINSSRENRLNAQLIKLPEQGDIYEVAIDYKQYTLYKVHAVKNDTVVIVSANEEVSKISKLDELKERGAAIYTKDTFLLSKDELEQLFEEGKIIDIHKAK